MSWLRIDDVFEDHAKVAPLSDAAHRLWMRAACWCKKAQNLHTNGFVPEVMLPTIARLPAPKARRLAQELVAAKGGGIFEHGLWEPKDGGWQFHDWAAYQPPEGPPAKSKSESGRIGGIRSAQVRKERNGTAQPPKQNAEASESASEADTFEPDPEATSKHSEAPGPGPVPGEKFPPPPEPVRQRGPDRFMGSFSRLRADVVELHRAYQRTFGLSGHKLQGASDLNAVTLAEAIDAHGLESCLAALAVAPADRMVNGDADERGLKHEKIAYLFGNPDTLARLLRAAEERARRPARVAADDAFDAAMEADAS